MIDPSRKQIEIAHVNISRYDMQTQCRGRQLIIILKESSYGVSMISDDTDDCDLLALYHFIEQAR